MIFNYFSTQATLVRSSYKRRAVLGSGCEGSAGRAYAIWIRSFR